MTEVRVINGSPRYHHKTTTLIEWVEDTPESTLFVADQHQLAEEVCHEHLGDTEYGIDAQSVVWVQGKERACPGCTHEIEQENYLKAERKAERALQQHDTVTPEAFSEVCPYIGCKLAAQEADWVVTVPEMIDRIDVNWDDYNVIVDEESTQKAFLPKEAKLFEINRINSPLVPHGTNVQEDLIGENDGLDLLIDRLQTKIDDLDRVPKRYRNILNAAHALEDFHETLVDRVNINSPEETIESLEEADIPDVELQGSKQEITKTFEYLRKTFGRYSIEPAIEAMLSNPKLHAQRSQDQWNVYLIPDPEADIIVQRSLFEDCERIGLVGGAISEYFLDHFYENPQQYIEQKEPVRTPNLDIAVVEGEEMQRRNTMTETSKELSESEIHNLLICGSGTRAAQAHERTSPRSYLFQGDATLEEYDVPADGDWSVVSYMGSRLTRGVDVDTQVTVVRSSQFASPRWHYYDNALCRWIRDYENLIETHNAMLRGAGQGEQHVAVVPALSSLFFGLQEYVTPFDVDDIEGIVQFIMEKLGEIVENLQCPDCDLEFVTQRGYREHPCVENDSAD